MRFTVRRPPSGEVSPCSHRPSGGDVACSVHVGVAPTSRAGLALEDRLALAVSGCDVPARGTTLRRIRGRDQLDPAKALCCKRATSMPPATSADSAVQPTFLSDSHARLIDGAARRAGHRPHIEGLDPDQVESPREVGGGLLHPVLTPIPLAGLQLRDRAFRLFAAVGATLGAGESLLQHLQPLRLTRGQTGYVQELAGGQRGRHGHTAVDADHTAVTWTGDRVGDVGERDMPAASPITGDPVGLHAVWHRARQAKSYPPDLGHPDSTEVAVQPLEVTGLHSDLSKPFVHSGFAPCRAAVRTVEEILHGLCEIPQRLLLHRLTPSTKPRILGARLSELRALLSIVWSTSTRLPVQLLLHRQIPHIPRVPAMRQQLLLLLRSRQQPKPRHRRTVTTDTDIPRRSTPALHRGSAYSPGLKSRVSSLRRLQ